MTPTPPRLSLRGIRKAFGATVALADVSLDAAPGEIHAVIGENGAGKSTLMKVLAGAIAPDAGEMALDDVPYRPARPIDARRHGVAMVYQELSLAPHLSVEENILLGSEPTRGGVIDRRAMRARVTALLSSLGHTDIRPDARVGDLSPAAQQVTEILRALAQSSCRVLILDEPTSSLAHADVERLFEVMTRLKQQGVTIIYISHVLEEIQRIADRITVLRDGRAVASGAMAGVGAREIVRHMAGREIDELFPRSVHAPADVVLELADVAGDRKPSHASLTLRRGEVLGIGGLIGSGRTELLRAIFGLDPVRRGDVRVASIRGPATASVRTRQGVGFLSENRKREGLAINLTIADNITLSHLDGLGPAGFVLPRLMRAACAPAIRQLSIRCRDAAQSTWELSGGNQQKVALARLLHQQADVLLLDEPTRGIDVAAKRDIYQAIDDLARAGKAILVVSSYLPELLGICDRIAIMTRGVLGDAKAVAECDAHSMLLEATG